jgi:hypothetical protein
MKETKEEAEEQIDKALEARKEETKSGAVTGRGSANACHRSGDSRKVPGQRNRKAGRKG